MTWRQWIRADRFLPGDEIIIKGHPCIVVDCETHWGTNAGGALCQWVWIRVSHGPGGVWAFRPHTERAGQRAAYR